MNIFVKNSQLLAKLRSVLKERNHLLTSLGARKKQGNMIKRLVTKLGEVLNPFSSGSAKNNNFGVLLDDLTVKGLLKSDQIGKKQLQD